MNDDGPSELGDAVAPADELLSDDFQARILSRDDFEAEDLGTLAKEANGCLSLAALHGALQGDPDPKFWAHLRACPRCTNAAVTLDPEVMLTTRDDYAKQATVIDPALYRDKRVFKRGGMYQTWTAIDRRLGRQVVIKGLPSELDEPDAQKRQLLQACLRRESHILASLCHPAIVTVLEAGEWRDGEAFYTTEFVAGETLADAIKTRSSLQARLELLPALTNIVDAVGYAHRQGIVHRDVSPYNIIVGNGTATLIDWTTAKRTQPEHGRETILDAAEIPHEGTLTLASWGTPGYAPPEQRATDGHDHRVDIFTLGATLHFLITGERPFGGDNVEEILGNVAKGARLTPRDCPPPLLSVIDKAMNRDPAERYATADALALDLRRFLTEQLVLVHEYNFLERFAHSRWFRPLLAALVVVLFALSAIVIAFTYDRREARLRAEALARVENIQSSSEREKNAMRASIEEMSVEATAQVRKALDEKEREQTLRRSAEAERASAMQSATMAFEQALRADEERLAVSAKMTLLSSELDKNQKRLDEVTQRIVERDLKIAASQDEIAALKEERTRLAAQNAELRETLTKLSKTVDALQTAVTTLSKQKRAEPGPLP
jgi:serine/threonine protein kinase/DNA-binding transcriptional ArsR family regulator